MVEFVPTLLPFNFHWYDGDAPPLVGVAVNVTELPAHTEVEDAETATDGVTLTVIVVAVEEVALAAVHPLPSV